MRTSHLRTRLLSMLTLSIVSLWSARSLAADDFEVPLGAKRQLVLSELAGLRLSPTGTSYAGPLGFSIGSVSHDRFNTDPNARIVTEKDSYTSFWLAPSADFFVIDRLSVGGLIELESTSWSTKRDNGSGTTITTDLPSTLTFGMLGRVGYMIPVGTRWGIWPRFGIGYHRFQQIIDPGIANPARDTFSALYLGLDCNFMWRASQQVFFVAAPEMIVAPDGGHTARQGNIEASADASAFQFAIRTGVGVLFDL